MLSILIVVWALMNQCCCDTTDKHFNENFVRAELDDYRRGKVQATTRMLVDSLRDVAKDSKRLLDIGGGIGIIAHELLAVSQMSATLVEISTSYLDAARAEAETRGLVDRMRFVQGDATDLPTDVSTADVVVLDRVVCCYENWQRLIRDSAATCTSTYAFSYPRDIWYVRLVIAYKNWSRRRAGSEFRTHVASEELMDRVVRAAGFDRITRRGNIAWRIAVYRRRAISTQSID